MQFGFEITYNLESEWLALYYYHELSFMIIVGVPNSLVLKNLYSMLVNLSQLLSSDLIELHDPDREFISFILNGNIYGSGP